MDDSSKIEATQRAFCRERNAGFVITPGDSKLGFASVTEGRRPLNGLRHPATGDTNGWYIWFGEEFSTAPNFFEPLHIAVPGLGAFARPCTRLPLHIGRKLRRRLVRSHASERLTESGRSFLRGQFPRTPHIDHDSLRLGDDLPCSAESCELRGSSVIVRLLLRRRVRCLTISVIRGDVGIIRKAIRWRLSVAAGQYHLCEHLRRSPTA